MKIIYFPTNTYIYFLNPMFCWIFLIIFALTTPLGAILGTQINLEDLGLNMHELEKGLCFSATIFK